MQNKGIVKLFALLFGLVSIYQLSFTFKANQIEDAAKKAAVAKYDETVDGYQDLRAEAEVRYLDSLKTEKVQVGESIPLSTLKNFYRDFEPMQLMREKFPWSISEVGCFFLIEVGCANFCASNFEA